MMADIKDLNALGTYLTEPDTNVIVTEITDGYEASVEFGVEVPEGEETIREIFDEVCADTVCRVADEVVDDLSDPSVGDDEIDDVNSVIGDDAAVEATEAVANYLGVNPGELITGD